MSRKGESIFKRKDGRYEARYPKEVDINGKIIKYDFVYGRTYTETKKKRLSVTKEMKKQQTNSFNFCTKFEKEIFTWLNSKTNIKDSTYYNYLSMLNGRIIPYFSKCNKIDEQKINKFISYLKDDNLSNKRIKELLILLNQFLKYKKIQIDIELPNVIKSKVTTFNDNEIRILEDYSLNSFNEFDFGILFTLFTGVRIGELCALKWEDIDIENNVIHITKTVSRIKNNNSKNKTILKITSPKSETSIRDIPINENIKELLIKFKNKSKDQY